MRPLRIVTALALLAVLSLLPLVLSQYYVGLVTQMMIYGIFAMSLDILLGHTGLPSLGHAAYFGVSGYTVGLLSLKVTKHFGLVVGSGLGTAITISAIFGLLAIRTHGAYFLMITLALAQVLWGIAFKWRSLTGGDDGLPGVPRPSLGIPFSLWNTTNFYYFALVLFVLVVIVLSIFIRSPFGHALRGIRESETRMRALGYNVWLYKYLAFIIAAIFGGVAGMLFTFYNGFVSPADLSIVLSAKVLLMVILGGAGTLLGPALGAGVIVLLENLISAQTERWLLILGAIYVAVVLFAPAGIIGTLKSKLRRSVST
ncbi:MAG: branched-chain amino acid ABC transporter permease [Candidatus Tectomicrobia bacterium]|uniref:Branched-chain amino acid ABC transporter permease n=1 Tax=Tectimicrobiota bacterium TaxID=2528274 RepID=A0A932GQQ4_UNCTE|nr:branched-chain amino acid ABC transporter permease [Candidatus Tectomicrobia bacterium]